MILIDITNPHMVYNYNPYLNKIRQRTIEKKKNLPIFDPYLDNLLITTQIDCVLIKNILHAFNCTFIPDTVFRFVTNSYVIGIKCMVIKCRDYQLEYNNPHKQLEWDTLYSEEKNQFHVIYFLFSPTMGKMFLKIGNEPICSIQEIISNIVDDKSNRQHINTCIQIFRRMYISKIFQ